MPLNTPVKSFTVGHLAVEVHSSRADAGRAAGEAVASRMRALLEKQRGIRMVFASAPSQVEFLATLAAQAGVDWTRVTAFHMDEYVGVAPEAEQSFGRFIRAHLLDAVRPGTAHFIDGTASPRQECQRYATLLEQAPIDIVCMGIGENGHIAFNDPEDADFDDPLVVKEVELEDASRRQQVHDGCFAELDAVPRHAITLTVPTLLGARFISCVVPAASKANAVKATLRGPIDTACPASALRNHPRAVLYLDSESAKLV